MKNVRKNLGTSTFFPDGAVVTRIVFINEQALSSAHLRHRLVQNRTERSLRRQGST